MGAVAADGVFSPVNPSTAKTEGYCIVTYGSREAASRAVAALDGADFDPSTKMRVMRLDELLALSPGEAPLQAPAVKHVPREDDWYWLLDEQCRDEFLLRFSNTESGKGKEDKHETEVLWANAQGAPSLDYGGETQKALRKVKDKFVPGVWADKCVAWSPQGTYLTTMHGGGAKLWHGRGFRSEGWADARDSTSFRLDHENVREVLWSPDERYLCTWNGCANNERMERAFVVWDARTGLEVRKFRQAEQQDDTHGFVWSADSRFLARIVMEVVGDRPVELIHVYEAPAFRLLEDRSIRAPGARDLAWAPARNNLLSWWSPEQDNLPITASIMAIPSKEYAKQRPLISVQDCRVLWHPQGEFCAIVAEKLTKGQLAKKKKTAGGGGGGGGEGGGLKGGGGKPLCAGFSVEVVRVLAKGGKMDVAVDILELKDRVLELAWEPHAARFAALTVSETVEKETFAAEVPGGLPKTKTTVKTAYHLAFFTVAEKPGGGIAITHAYTVDRPPASPVASALLWSPRGEVVVLSNFATSSSGWLQFFDADRKRVLAETAHDGASGMAWDPSGRLLATFKTRAIEGLQHVRESVTNGYKLWTFQGGRVHEADKPKLFQFLWRPRPTELLAEEEARGVAKNLRAYIQKHADEDKAKLERRALLERLRKRVAREEFRNFVAERFRDWEENAAIRESKGLLPWNWEVRGEEVEEVEVLLTEDVQVVPVPSAPAAGGGWP